MTKLIDESSYSGFNKILHTYYQDQLKRNTQDNDLDAWAEIHQGFARFSYDLAMVTCDPHRLQDAIDAYNESLKVITKNDYPEDYVRIQNSIGDALEILSEMMNEPSFLEEAVMVYRDALDVYKIIIEPAVDTIAQVKLESAFCDAGTRFDDAECRDETVLVCCEVLKFQQLKPNCPSSESIKASLSRALEALGVRTADVTCLLEAKKLLRDVLEVASDKEWIQERIEQIEIAISNTGESIR